MNMNYSLKQEGKFNYVEIGEGQPIIILHGLMGGLSNFDGVAEFFSKNGYMVVLPELPLYSLSLLEQKNKLLGCQYAKESYNKFKYKDALFLYNSFCRN